MTEEDSPTPDRLTGTEFLLETRIRYELHQRVPPLPKPAPGGEEPEEDDAGPAVPAKPAGAEKAAPAPDEEQKLRAAAFLLATRSDHEATTRTLLHGLTGTTSPSDAATDADPRAQQPGPVEGA